MTDDCICGFDALAELIKRGRIRELVTGKRNQFLATAIQIFITRFIILYDKTFHHS